MAYNEITEDNVYLCVGHPPRRDIENIVKWMLNDHFSVAYSSILCDSDSAVNFFSYVFIFAWICGWQCVVSNLAQY